MRTLPQRGAMAEAGRRLEATLGPAEDVGIAVTVQRLRGRTRRRSTPGCFPRCQHSALVSPPSSLGPEFPRSSATCSTFGLPSPVPSGPQLYPRRKVQRRSQASVRPYPAPVIGPFPAPENRTPGTAKEGEVQDKAP